VTEQPKIVISESSDAGQPPADHVLLYLDVAQLRLDEHHPTLMHDGDGRVGLSLSMATHDLPAAHPPRGRITLRDFTRLALELNLVNPAVDLRCVGQTAAVWREMNFGQQSHMRMALQICEEAGEVARVIGKADEGIRPETRGNLAEELCDVILASAAMAAQCDIDIEAAMAARIKRMLSLDFRDDPEGGVR